MTALRVVAALVLKNLVHHLGMLVWAGLLFAALLVTAWSSVLIRSENSVIDAGVGALYYLGPLVVILINERLVARDLADGTSEFLAALPLSTPLRLGVPYLMGLGLTLLLTELTLMTTALLALRMQGLPGWWLLQLHWQCGLYMVAWHAVSFAVAWFGRWRWLLWWALLAGASSIGAGWVSNAFSSLMWHAVLAEPLDHGRSLPPYGAVPITLAWTVGALVLGFSIAAFKGGMFPDRWYGVSNARQRATVMLGMILVLTLEPILLAIAPSRPPLQLTQPVPATHAVVHLSGGGQLREVGQEAASILDDLGEVVGVEAWPSVLLYPSPRGLDRHIRLPPGGGAELALLVDPDGPTQSLAREIATYVLQEQAGSLGLIHPDLDALAHGAPGWVRPSSALERRLAWVEDPTADHPGQRLSAGRDVAEAVAVARLQSLGDSAPCVLRHAFSTRRASGLLASLWASWTLPEGWMRARCGAGPSQSWAEGRAPRRALPKVEIEIDQGVLVALFSHETPPGAVLRRQALDDLERRPRDTRPWRLHATEHDADLPLDFSLSQPLAVELVLFDPSLEGWHSSGVAVR
ncbi:MAG: hypothetical protein EA397_12305 [Deltaproteobacteria bacterium]|nr:MAG: hypothetical protein EA397_12305 [Deltaproteobacteria bacterium]